MDRPFLDANVLYSAAYMDSSSFQTLWELDKLELLTSAHAADEARHNLNRKRPQKLSQLERLLTFVQVVTEPINADLPPGVSLADKDKPIILAAIGAAATHLLTGDRRHFGHLYGTTIAGVTIVSPSAYLQSRRI